MDFVTSVRTCLHKYADFDGRATRSEFWWFYLFVALCTLVVYAVSFMFSIVSAFMPNDNLRLLLSLASFGTNLLVMLVVLGLLIPLLAVGCRRLHDYGQSGWLQVLMAVPCGSIVLIVLWAMEGTPGPNAYGLPPAPRVTTA